MRDAERDAPAFVDGLLPPSTRIAMNLVAPSPSRTIACASATAHCSMAARIGASRGSSALVIGASFALAGRGEHEAVVGRRVAVDGGAVERDVGDLAHDIAPAAAPRSAASVAMNASIVAMSGWIMPAPLAMPVTVTGTPATSTRREAPLGTVSVVMIALAAANQPSARAAVRAAGKRAEDPLDGQRLHDDAGGVRQHFLGRAVEQPRDGDAFGVRIGEP